MLPAYEEQDAYNTFIFISSRRGISETVQSHLTLHSNEQKNIVPFMYIQISLNTYMIYPISGQKLKLWTELQHSDL